MINTRLSGLCILSLLFLSQATNAEGMPTHKPFYVGFLAGFGSTTWDGLVPTSSNQGNAMVLSTPIGVNEGGGVWGVVAGYVISSSFSLEANYTKYQQARVYFDHDSLFAYFHDLKMWVQAHPK